MTTLKNGGIDITTLIEHLSGKEYVGRFFWIGGSEKFGKDVDVVIYGLTGRSAPSRARKLVAEGECIRVKETDPEAIRGGNPALLLYNAIRAMGKEVFIVSNGAQTDMIANSAGAELNVMYGRLGPRDALMKAFEKPYTVPGYKAGEEIDLTQFEPDEPNFTPRISCVKKGDWRCIHLARRNDDGSLSRETNTYCRDRDSRISGRFVSTYTGQNVPKGVRIPSFEGNPIRLDGPRGSLDEMTEQVYEALGPKTGEGIVSPGEDFRVAVVSAYLDPDGNIKYSIKNRVEQ